MHDPDDHGNGDDLDADPERKNEAYPHPSGAGAR